MIFYIATDSHGKKHALTVETEAKKIDKAYTTIDQPNDKASLKALIQESFDHIHLLEQKISSLLDQQIEDIDTSDIPEAGEEFFEKATLRSPPAPPAPAAPEPGVAELPEVDESMLDVRTLEAQVSALGLAGVDGLAQFDGWEQVCGISASFQQGVALLNIVAADDSAIAKIYLRDKIQKRVQRRTY
jgi:hypothetical protein